MNERIGARPWLAQAQEDYTRMLRRRGGQVDDERARKLLADALEDYRELGMHTCVARIAALSQ